MRKSYGKTGWDNCPKELSKNLKAAPQQKGTTMKTMNNTKIIGIDHGYGNMKTANHYFPSGILSFDAEPLFTGDKLVGERVLV